MYFLKAPMVFFSGRVFPGVSASQVLINIAIVIIATAIIYIKFD